MATGEEEEAETKGVCRWTCTASMMVDISLILSKDTKETGNSGRTGSSFLCWQREGGDVGVHVLRKPSKLRWILEELYIHTYVFCICNMMRVPVVLVIVMVVSSRWLCRRPNCLAFPGYAAPHQPPLSVHTIYLSVVFVADYRGG